MTSEKYRKNQKGYRKDGSTKSISFSEWLSPGEQITIW